MLGLGDVSIAQKLTWMSLFGSATAVIVMCFALMTYDFLDFRESLFRNRMVQAQILGANTQTALIFDDPEAASRTLATLSSAAHIEAAALYRRNGDLFATYRRDATVAPIALPWDISHLTDRHSFDGIRQMHLVHAIFVDDEPIGTVYIRSDLGEVTDRLKQFGIVTSVALLIALGAALVVSGFLRQSITRPIAELASVAGHISTDRDYTIRAMTAGEGEVAVLVSAFNEMLSQIQRRDRSLQESYDLLEQRVQQRTAELNASNKELEAFCYSVSHDLRSPLRSIDGFSLALLDDYEASLNDEAKSFLHRIRAATQRMGTLIDDLLSLSRITRTSLRSETVNVTDMARAVATDLAAGQPERNVSVTVQEGMTASADSRLLRQVFENLIGNAWKFTAKQPSARIEVGVSNRGGAPIFFVKDNGAGFDSAYADRLFGVFQRLHAMTEFPGTGVGLAIVERIIHRHGGRVWADGAVGRGATFYFTLAGSAAPSA